MFIRILPCVCFSALMLAVGFASSFYAMPGVWYEGLNKPTFNPPNWIFGPVWTTLYLLIGSAGGIVWNHRARSTSMKLWWTQMVLNGIWRPVFFAFQMPSAALIVILLMLATIIAFMKSSFKQTPVATYLFVPYFAWVAFATILNASIVWLNRG